MNLINWLLNPKMHTKIFLYKKNTKTHHIFLFFQNMIFYYFLRDLAVFTPNKTYFYIFEMRRCF
jgi:hypothetical protein